MSHFDSPASMSMHEEATGAVNRPMMGVFNNLVLFDQQAAQNSMGSIVPDLATGADQGAGDCAARLREHGGDVLHRPADQPRRQPDDHPVRLSAVG